MLAIAGQRFPKSGSPVSARAPQSGRAAIPLAPTLALIARFEAGDCRSRNELKFSREA